jgi:hypothetical protein
MSFGWPGARATTSFFKLAITRAEANETTTLSTNSHRSAIVPVVVTVCAVVVIVGAIVAVLLFVMKNRSDSRNVHLLAAGGLNESA